MAAAAVAAQQHDHLGLEALQAEFAEHFPLPLRILCLISAGILLYASNLHVLNGLGIDTAAVLDVRADLLPLGTSSSSGLSPPLAFIHPSKLYRPVYLLALTYFGWTALAWTVFSCWGDRFPEAHVKYVPAAFALVAILAVFLPTERLQRRERFMFLRSLRRVFLDALWSPVPFCDVILADILTSYAKVLGDVWICVGMLIGTDTRENWGGHWGVPLLTSVPYILRFRQCISEYLTTPTSHSYPDPSHAALTAAITPQNARTRSLCNALKYASAFPVIFFSAMQTRSDLFDEISPEEQAEIGGWRGPRALFALWILAVCFNSFYSFWWDVTNDWGLSLLIPRSWKATPAFVAAHLRRMSLMSPPPSNPASFDAKYGQLHSRARSITAVNAKAEEHLGTSSRGVPPPQQVYSATNHAVLHSSANPLLRPALVLPDTALYYAAIAVDLLLRFTWSLKLSTHLHAIHEIEQGLFLLELLEVVRRWVWVFIRIEWEAVRKGGAGYDKIALDAVPLLEKDADT